MMRKLFQRFQNAYEPLVVLLIVGVALLLIYALYRATGGRVVLALRRLEHGDGSTNA